MARKTVTDLLIQKGRITPEQLSIATEAAGKEKVSLEKSLEKLGLVNDIDIAMAQAEVLQIPFMDLSEYAIDIETVKIVPETLVKKYKLVPLFKIGDTLTIAMADPGNILALDEVRIKSKLEVIETVLSTLRMIQGVIDKYYGAASGAAAILQGLTREKFESTLQSVKKDGGVVDVGPVIELVNLMIIQASNDRASDIHIEPAQEKVSVRCRIDGILQETQELPKYLQNAIVSRIKIMANMDIVEKRSPQDGRIRMPIDGKEVDLRVSTFPTMYGENIVLRILDRASLIKGLPELGFLEDDLNNFYKLVSRPNGIILVTGPTASGKTTTLYAALLAINNVGKNIITIEDPIEYEIPLIRQTQVDPKAGLTFVNGLRSILRQDPNVIMVGEIRDKETADIAIQASLTGHLVFSTLHTNDATSALTRLIDMGVEPFLAASSVSGILAQRLVRLICVKCKEKYTPSLKELESLGIMDSKNEVFYRGHGCSNCKNTGFLGRIGIFELLIVSDEIKNMVIAKMAANVIRSKAVGMGMRSLYDDGVDKIRKGLTTPAEVLRVAENA